MAIGIRTAEEIKISIGSAYPTETEESMKIRGRDLVSGLPKTLTITSGEILEALKEPVGVILDGVKSSLEKTPPELASDVMDRGIMVSGGGALLKGIDELIRKETGMPVQIAETPLDCVAMGAGKALEQYENINQYPFSAKFKR